MAGFCSRCCCAALSPLCCAWEHCDSSSGDVLGLAGGQGLAGCLCCWPGLAGTAVGASARGTRPLVNPCGSREIWKGCGCGCVSAAAGTALKGWRPRDESVLQQVDPEVSVPVDKSMLCGHG